MVRRAANLSARLIVTVLMLSLFGLVMLFSISGPRGEVQYGNPYFFILRQGIFLLLGIAGMVVAARTDYRKWFRFVWVLFGVTALLLLLVYVKPIGQEINGSSRWIRVPGIPVQLQPSEIAKLAMLLFVAHWHGTKFEKWPGLWKGFCLPMGIVGVLLALIVFEVDFGATTLIAATAVLMFLAAGMSWLWVLVVGVVGSAGLGFAASLHPERMARMVAFLHPEEHASDKAYQLINALYGFVAGGAKGLGLGQGLQKQRYLPEAHTDFIFACIGEELGIFFTMAILIAFVFFLLTGLRIAARSKDRRGQLLAFGITVLISLQALINIGVVTGCLPTKGLALPFISYGGSGLLVLLFMVGILVNIANHPDPASEDEE